jgi:plasmid maintenance system killer protein
VLDTTPTRTPLPPPIVSFRDKRTAAIFRGKLPEGFPSDLGSVSRRKLAVLDAAAALEDLRQPPATVSRRSRTTDQASTASE